MSKKRTVCVAIGLLACVLAAGPVWGSFTPITQPVDYPGGTTLIQVSGADGDPVGSVSGGGLTVTFSATMLIEKVPTGWGTWGSPPDTETSTPVVLWAIGVTDLTMNLSSPEAVFGFEAEPDFQAVESMTANFYSGPNLGGILLGSISLDVNGASGALLFAASSDPFQSVELVMNNPLTIDGVVDDFAIANLRFSPAVPEPASVLLLGAGLAGFGLRQLRRKK